MPGDEIYYTTINDLHNPKEKTEAAIENAADAAGDAVDSAKDAAGDAVDAAGEAVDDAVDAAATVSKSRSSTDRIGRRRDRHDR